VPARAHAGLARTSERTARRPLRDAQRAFHASTSSEVMRVAVDCILQHLATLRV
jgi:hypothetical protein